jgi:hypothetical protein
MHERLGSGGTDAGDHHSGAQQPDRIDGINVRCCAVPVSIVSALVMSINATFDFVLTIISSKRSVNN